MSTTQNNANASNATRGSASTKSPATKAPSAEAREAEFWRKKEEENESRSADQAAKIGINLEARTSQRRAARKIQRGAKLPRSPTPPPPEPFYIDLPINTAPSLLSVPPESYMPSKPSIFGPITPQPPSSAEHPNSPINPAEQSKAPTNPVEQSNSPGNPLEQPTAAKAPGCITQDDALHNNVSELEILNAYADEQDTYGSVDMDWED